MNLAHTISQANTLPTLYKLDSKGNVQIWVVSTFESMEGGHIETKHGREGGKIQVSEEIISEGKNVGRSNETTPYQQAESEAQSRWTKQVERKGYVDSRAKLGTDQRQGAEPMLAHRYDKFPEKIQFPCAVQPKLDGHRCIAIVENGSVKLFSRQRKPITGLPHVEQEILKMCKAYYGTPLIEKLVLDGELYNHEYKNKFEQLTSFIRSSTPKEGHEVVQYHIYDTVAEGDYNRRYGLLTALTLSYTGSTIHLVDTQLAGSSEDIVEQFGRHRGQGYEGSMLRNLDSTYAPRRSYDLLKVKTFLDEEFMVTGVEEGRGKMAGHAIFVLNTEDGKEFRAKMKGSMETLADYFKNPELALNKLVTVQFQDWTAEGIPRFPVVLRFREDA